MKVHQSIEGDQTIVEAEAVLNTVFNVIFLLNFLVTLKAVICVKLYIQ